MKFPNKINRYRTTVLCHMAIILSIYSQNISVTELYEKASKEMTIKDFFDALTCLYAIGGMRFDENGGIKRC